MRMNFSEDDIEREVELIDNGCGSRNERRRKDRKNAPPNDIKMLARALSMGLGTVSAVAGGRWSFAKKK